ncbi:MAG: hypothetical protein PHY92_11070, partial [Alphaproteobacteria bacterium]|nr:hypothetical protein [Alphaproteobacteria bacterium]
MNPSNEQAASAESGKGKKRIKWFLLALVVLGIAAWFFLRPAAIAPQHSGRAGANGGVVPVLSATAQKGDVNVTLTALGTVTPLAAITV